MFHNLIRLKKHYPIENDPTLEIMTLDTEDNREIKKRKTILIIPGGAYAFVSYREADAPAVSFLARDYNVAVLRYTVNQKYPTQIIEVMCAMDYSRKNADKYGILKDKISIIGFSAGGHLCASYGYEYSNKVLLDSLSLSFTDTIPNALLLCYPVITLGKDTHQLTCDIISNGDITIKNHLSVEKHITPSYPKTFVWTLKTDEIVPYVNSILLVDALKRNNIEHQFVLYEHGCHGISVANKMLINNKEEISIIDKKDIADWIEKADEFLNSIFGEYHF